MDEVTQALVDKLVGNRVWYDYFNQGEVWKPDKRPMFQIVDMPREWRLNCARFLERRALGFAQRYAFGCEAVLWGAMGVLNGEMARDSVTRELDAEAAYARDYPTEWMRSTPLFLSLVNGLPTKGKELRALRERADHWDGCAWRSDRSAACTCIELRAAHEMRGVTDEEPVQAR